MHIYLYIRFIYLNLNQPVCLSVWPCIYVFFYNCCPLYICLYAYLYPHLRLCHYVYLCLRVSLSSRVLSKYKLLDLKQLEQ